MVKIMRNTVSVVIPVYNGEVFVERAIESILKQTVKPFELIVVNDGSTDGTADKLAAFGDRITVKSIPNGGVANARNIGIQASSGEFIAFLDADDVWYEDKLKLQLDIFERYPDVGFCCCDYITLNKNINTTVSHFARFKEDDDFNFDQPLRKSGLELLIKTNFVGTCSNVMFRRKLLEQVGIFNVQLKQSEDYDMWLRLSLVTKFVLMSTPLLEKKTHDANLTNDFLESLLFREKVLINLVLNNKAKELITKIKGEYHSAIASGRYEIGNLLYESDHRIQAFKYFFLGLTTSFTFKNFRLFSYFFGRKLLRTISFGLIRNTNTFPRSGY